VQFKAKNEFRLKFIEICDLYIKATKKKKKKKKKRERERIEMFMKYS
jgi:hypothetical protein